MKTYFSHRGCNAFSFLHSDTISLILLFNQFPYFFWQFVWSSFRSSCMINSMRMFRNITALNDDILYRGKQMNSTFTTEVFASPLFNTATMGKVGKKNYWQIWPSSQKMFDKCWQMMLVLNNHDNQYVFQLIIIADASKLFLWSLTLYEMWRVRPSRNSL